MKKPILIKLEPEYIALLRAYRAENYLSVNYMVNRAVERHLATLYQCETCELKYMAREASIRKFLPKD